MLAASQGGEARLRLDCKGDLWDCRWKCVLSRGAVCMHVGVFKPVEISGRFRREMCVNGRRIWMRHSFSMCLGLLCVWKHPLPTTRITSPANISCISQHLLVCLFFVSYLHILILLSFSSYSSRRHTHIDTHARAHTLLCSCSGVSELRFRLLWLAH